MSHNLISLFSILGRNEAYALNERFSGRGPLAGEPQAPPTARRLKSRAGERSALAVRLRGRVDSQYGQYQ